MHTVAAVGNGHLHLERAVVGVNRGVDDVHLAGEDFLAVGVKTHVNLHAHLHLGKVALVDVDHNLEGLLLLDDQDGASRQVASVIVLGRDHTAHRGGQRRVLLHRAQLALGRLDGTGLGIVGGLHLVDTLLRAAANLHQLLHAVKVALLVGELDALLVDGGLLSGDVHIVKHHHGLTGAHVAAHVH